MEQAPELSEAGPGGDQGDDCPGLLPRHVWAGTLPPRIGQDPGIADGTDAASASTCTRRTPVRGGETEQRIYALNAWRETPFFSDRERAALAWVEALTHIGNGVPDDLYARRGRSSPRRNWST